MRRFFLLCAVAGLTLAGCAQPQGAASAARAAAPIAVDSARLMVDLRVLAADSMEGRRTGTAGSERARRFLLAEFERAGLQAFGAGFARPFPLSVPGVEATRGINLIGFVPGTVHADRYLVVTAHYDHVGVRDGQIYNGADDNASGVAALLALARHFRANPPAHSVVFAALDAEEMGLRGARALVQDPPFPREAILVNVNMDMVGRNQAGELYAAGAYHSPFLRPLLQRVAATAPVRLRLGHDSPELGSGDWTKQSDHGAFHEAGIPFVYFGVEDHPDYHRPSDDAESIQPGFFARAVQTVAAAVARFAFRRRPAGTQEQLAVTA